MEEQTRLYDWLIGLWMVLPNGLTGEVHFIHRGSAMLKHSEGAVSWVPVELLRPGDLFAFAAVEQKESSDDLRSIE